MTLLEILMVLGVIAAASFLGYYAINAISKSALRTDTVEVAAALKSAQNLAAQSGMHHRVVFDLDKQSYRVEVCPDPIQLLRGDEEEKVDQEALERLAEQPGALAQGGGQLGAAPTGIGMAPGGLGALGMMGGGLGSATGEVTEAASPEAALEAAAALAGVRVGSSRCGIAPASGGDQLNHKDPQAPNIHELAGKGRGIKLRRVYVQHLREEVSSGEVSINFFPLGHAEKAVLELGDDEGSQYSVLVHGLTGRIELRDGEIDPDKHMRRNAAGDQVDDR
jgi:type II secretory pathway pseudopilin PulG